MLQSVVSQALTVIRVTAQFAVGAWIARRVIRHSQVNMYARYATTSRFVWRRITLIFNFSN